MLVAGITLVLGGLSACRTSARDTRSREAIERGDSVAHLFAPGAISRGHEFMVTLAPDQRSAFAVRRLGGRDGIPLTLTIVESHFQGGAWSAATPASFSGVWRDIDPVISPDGRRLYFNSNRRGPGRDSAAADFDIWYVEPIGAAWGEPRRLGTPVNTSHSEYFASVTRSGTLYYTSALAETTGETVIVRARPIGHDGYAAPETLSVVNGVPRNAGNPFIAPDESYLIFVAERAGGFGDSDLYVSVRDGSGWSVPRNLGSLVNTRDAEFAPSVSSDGRHLFFTRMIRGENRRVQSEQIMVIDRDLVLPEVRNRR